MTSEMVAQYFTSGPVVRDKRCAWAFSVNSEQSENPVVLLLQQVVSQLKTMTVTKALARILMSRQHAKENSSRLLMVTMVQMLADIRDPSADLHICTRPHRCQGNERADHMANSAIIEEGRSGSSLHQCYTEGDTEEEIGAATRVQSA